MTAVTYTAKRSLVAGHVAGSSYTIDIPVVSMPINRVPNKRIQESLSLVRETIYLSTHETWEVQTALLNQSKTEAVKEFLDSVEDGTVFSFDPYGRANTPHNPLTAEIESSGYSQTREARGQGGANDSFRFTFTVRVIV